MPNDDLSSIPGDYMASRENRLHIEVMVLLCKGVHTHIHTHNCVQFKQINKIKQQKRKTLNKKEHFEQRETLKSNMGEVREMWTVYRDLIHQALGWCVQRVETRKEERKKISK